MPDLSFYMYNMGNDAAITSGFKFWDQLRITRLLFTHGSDVSGYLENYKPGMSDEYNLKFIGPSEVVGISVDTRYKLSLHLNNNPFVDGQAVALIGFDLDSKLTLMVGQIQGHTKDGYDMRDFLPEKWDRMLLNILELFGIENEFKRIAVQKAEDHPYYKKPYKITDEKEIFNIRQSMKYRYNKMPKELGFEFDEKLDCLVKYL